MRLDTVSSSVSSMPLSPHRAAESGAGAGTLLRLFAASADVSNPL